MRVHVRVCHSIKHEHKDTFCKVHMSWGLQAVQMFAHALCYPMSYMQLPSLCRIWQTVGIDLDLPPPS